MPDINPGRQLKQRIPDVVKVREFLEITRDFRDPKEAIREAISNALDWGASNVWIEVWEDKTRPDEEIIIRIRDDGVGLTEARLEAFFNLGDSTGHELDHYSTTIWEQSDRQDRREGAWDEDILQFPPDRGGESK